MLIMERVSHILRGCAYGTASGMCSPSGAFLDVCAFMYASTAPKGAARAVYPSS